MKKRFIPAAEPDLTGNEKKYLLECIKTGWVSSLGPFVKKLEENFAKYCGTKFAAAVSSGTAGLHLALIACGIGEGDEVIVPTLTFVATANAVRYVGAKPVFVDSEPVTWNMDVTQVEALITPATKAVIPVHLFGNPVEMEPLAKLSKKYHLYVIEDAAEAHGAEYKGKKVGCFGNLAVFSLFGNKVITSGEGGLVVTNSQKFDSKVRLYRDQGMRKGYREKYHYWHPVIGYNYDMSNLQAAVACAQLERISQFLEKKRQIAATYTKLLKDVNKITLCIERPWTKNVFWMYSILLNKNAEVSRDQMIRLLRVRGIDSRPFFYPIHTLPPYKSSQKFPVAERLAARGLSLPSSVNLGEKDLIHITNAVKEILGYKI